MTMTNRQMAAAFKKIGFHKSELQMTRMGNSYTYKDSKALFTFPKGHKENFQISTTTRTITELVEGPDASLQASGPGAWL